MLKKQPITYQMCTTITSPLIKIAKSFCIYVPLHHSLFNIFSPPSAFLTQLVCCACVMCVSSCACRRAAALSSSHRSCARQGCGSTRCFPPPATAHSAAQPCHSPARNFTASASRLFGALRPLTAPARCGGVAELINITWSCLCANFCCTGPHKDDARLKKVAPIRTTQG